MDAGTNVLYPAQAVDGLVHMHAGPELARALRAMPERSANTRCRVGESVCSAPYGLAALFDLLVHTPTPFYPANSGGTQPWRADLLGCYRSAVAVAMGVLHQAHPQGFVFDTPLLGAGAAGAPPHEAAAVAASAVECVAEDSQQWSCDLILRFVLRETAGSFVRALQNLGASELPKEPP